MRREDDMFRLRLRVATALMTFVGVLVQTVPAGAWTVEELRAAVKGQLNRKHAQSGSGYNIGGLTPLRRSDS